MNDIIQGSWHLEKKISVGHIITTLMLFVGIVSAWMSMSDRIAAERSDRMILETRFNGHAAVQAKAEGVQADLNKEILAEIKLLRREANAFYREHTVQ